MVSQRRLTPPRMFRPLARHSGCWHGETASTLGAATGSVRRRASALPRTDAVQPVRRARLGRRTGAGGGAALRRRGRARRVRAPLLAVRARRLGPAGVLPLQLPAGRALQACAASSASGCWRAGEQLRADRVRVCPCSPSAAVWKQTLPHRMHAGGSDTRKLDLGASKLG